MIEKNTPLTISKAANGFIVQGTYNDKGVYVVALSETMVFRVLAELTAWLHLHFDGEQK